MTCPKCNENEMYKYSKMCKSCYKKVLNSRTGEDNPKWKGGFRLHDKGYILKLVKGHPFASSQGFVYEHRLVMEKKLGRYLEKTEVVHHLNGIKNDNRPENLELHENNKEHMYKKHSWAKSLLVRTPQPSEIALVGSLNQDRFISQENLMLETQ